MEKSKAQLLARFFLEAPKCGAKTKRNEHAPCRQPAMKNGRCRMHGGKSTGPKTPEGKMRSALANTKHGRYTKSSMEENKHMRTMMGWRHDLDDLSNLE